MREAVPETINLFGNTIIRTLNTYLPLTQPLPLINARPGPGIDSAYSVVNALYEIGRRWCGWMANESLRVVFKILTYVFIQITDSIIESLSKRFRHPKLAKLLKNAWLVAKWTVGVMGVAAPVMVQLPDSGGKASYVDTQFLCALDYLNEIRDRMLEDRNASREVMENGYSEAIKQACAMYYHNSIRGTVSDFDEYLEYLQSNDSTRGLFNYYNQQLMDRGREIREIAAGLSTAAQHRPAIADRQGDADEELPDPIPEGDPQGSNSPPLSIGGTRSSQRGILSSPRDSEVSPLVAIAPGWLVLPYDDRTALPPKLKDTRYIPARRRGMAGIAKKLNELVPRNKDCLSRYTDRPVDVWKPDEWFDPADKTYLKGILNSQKTSTPLLPIEDKKPSSSKKKKKSNKNKKTSSNSEALQI